MNKREQVPAVIPRHPTSGDPLNLAGRLYKQVDALLNQLEAGEHITLKERVLALVAIGRIQIMFAGLRKEKVSDDPDRAGSAVRKYAGAFQADDIRGRKVGTRRAARPTEPEPDDIGSLLAEATGDDEGDEG